MQHDDMRVNPKPNAVSLMKLKFHFWTINHLCDSVLNNIEVLSFVLLCFLVVVVGEGVLGNTGPTEVRKS